jgi:hypothetical protein
LLKIVSGGQTGVDRGALDAALDLRCECGGWCPAGRLAEDGRIPKRYPVREMPTAEYSARTARNVAESDGTLIITNGPPKGGTRETVEFCREQGKPHLVIDCEELSVEEAIQRAVQFVRELPGVPRDPSASLGMTLNIGGPRVGQWPGGHEIAYEIISAVLRRFSGHEGGDE